MAFPTSIALSLVNSPFHRMSLRILHKPSQAWLHASPLRSYAIAGPRYLHASTSKSVDHKLEPKDASKPSSTTNNETNKPKRKMSAKERDELMMQRMKERMGQEGDEAWEDGRPPESGLPRNVKNNMFRLI